MSGLADSSRYWYLYLKEELIKLGANVSSVDLGLLYWKEHYKLVGIIACHVDDMIWGGNDNFNINVFSNLKNTCLILKKKKLSHTWTYN